MTQYIGYDLGDGDTLVSFRRKGSDVENALMPGLTSGQKGGPIPTVLAIHEDGTVNIGKTAIETATPQDFAEISVNFKRRPSTLTKDEYNAFRDRVVRFTDALFLHEEFFKNTIDPDDSQLELRLGYPTLWNAEDVARYQKILKSCGFMEKYRKKGINVSLGLEKESRAAMLNIVNRNDVATGSKNANVKIENGSYVVVFDFGSSTTDVTVLKRDGDYSVVPRDYGDCNLGARLIDRGIYRLIMEQLDSKLQEQHRGCAYLTSQSVYMCRGAKERYFTASPTERAKIDWESSLPSRRVFPLGMYFDGALVHQATTIQWPDELGGQSYKDAVRKLFTDVAKSMKAEGLKPSLIILTGGASRMDFVQTLCQEAFSNTTIFLDFEPSSCISRGLVWTATIGEKVKRFEERVRQFCESSEIGKIIDEESPKLADEIAQYIRDKTLEIMEREIFRWRNGYTSTLNRMEREIKSSVESFLNGKECEQKIENITAHWFSERVIWRIDQKITGICSDFGVVYQNQLRKYVEAVQRGVNRIVVGGIAVDLSPAVAGAIQEVFLKFVPILIVVLMPIIISVIFPLIMAIISGITTIIAGIIFFLLGTVIPGGWGIIAAVVGVGLVVLTMKGWQAAKEAFMDNVKDFNLPQLVRNAVGDGKIRSELNGKKSEIYSKIASGIKNNSRFRSELRKNVASAAGKIVQEVTKQITFDLNR